MHNRRSVVTLGDMTDLANKTIAVLATNGFEDSELTSPVEAVKNAGATVHIISTKEGTIEGKNGTTVDVDKLTSKVSADDYDALILPGGTVNADQIRIDEDAVELVKGINAADKPIGVICHGGWILTDADVLKGRKMTSFISIKTDLINAGANWVDEEVVVDGNLISSRTPADLEVFNKALVENF